MHPRRTRYLAFIDYLGSQSLYRDASANAELLEDRRYEIEHAIHIVLQPHLVASRVEVGLFSDTTLLAGVSLGDVLDCASLLLDFSLRKTLSRNNPDDIRLLRGAIAKGIELRSAYLRPSSNVSVIPFFDSGLAIAYQLEGVRRGSRIYCVGETTAPEDTLNRFFFTWDYVSGFGRPAADVLEFLWPAYRYIHDPIKLSRLLLEMFTFLERSRRGAPTGPGSLPARHSITWMRPLKFLSVQRSCSPKRRIFASY